MDVPQIWNVSDSSPTLKRELTCPVCFVPFRFVPKVFSCGHSFCDDCIYSMRKQNKIFSCPYCRKKVSTVSNNYILAEIPTACDLLPMKRSRGTRDCLLALQMAVKSLTDAKDFGLRRYQSHAEEMTKEKMLLEKKMKKDTKTLQQLETSCKALSLTNDSLFVQAEATKQYIDYLEWQRMIVCSILIGTGSLLVGYTLLSKIL